VGVFADAVRARGAGAAVVDGRGALGRSELADRADALAAALCERGLRPGGRVVLLSGNRSEVLEIHLACLDGGWTCLPLNWNVPVDELARALGPSADTALVVGSGHVRAAVAMVDRAGDVGGDLAPRTRLVMEGSDPPEGWESYEGALAAAGRPDDALALAPGRIAFPTAGASGRTTWIANPMSAPRTIDDLFAAAAANACGMPDVGRPLLCGPHYHWAQWAFGLLPVITGSTVVMHPRFVPEQVLRTIDAEDVTSVHLVPTQFVRLLRLGPRGRERFSGSSLEAVVHGSASCAPDTKRVVIEWLGPIVTEYYGATEIGVVSAITSDEWLEHPGSVGRPQPADRVRLAATGGGPALPGVDGILEVRVAAPIVAVAGAEPSVTSTDDGYVSVGDLGMFDDDGYLYLADRRMDRIVSRGAVVEPYVVENVLARHPAIADVAVFGVPDPDGGEDVKAVVQLAEGHHWTSDLERELHALCRAELQAHHQPKSFDVVSLMPRNAVGKLLKRQLSAPYWTNRSRKI
jgi:long-chain acyl-CoA synthetase